jgi:type III restriction enzyme
MEFVGIESVADLIENPVINSPYVEPAWHFGFDKGGITANRVEGRRESEFFIPVPQPKVMSAKEQLQFDALQLRRERNQLINAIRLEVRTWRRSSYPGVTTTTRRLLDYWQRPDREPNQRLFFCQLEAAETAIYLAELASAGLRRKDRRSGDLSIAEQLDSANFQYNDGLPRTAFKIATGGGKTVVMAMLIAWQALNRAARPGDDRFCSNFLMVTPGITVRDRLQVLRPQHEASYYRVMDVVPRELNKDLLLADVEIINYHQFLPRSKMGASKLARQILRTNDIETEDEVVRRVLVGFERLMGTGRRMDRLIVFNDEAHHCYKASQAEADKEEAALTGDEKDEVRRERAAAHTWYGGLGAIQRRQGINAIYDLSATPFFLKGSGYGEGKLFPWVASDFALIDAIESGIVKVPRVPVKDDASQVAAPVFLRLWDSVKDELPKGKKPKTGPRADLTLPPTLEQAMRLLYASYERSQRLWRDANMPTDPAFIVVCSNTKVSKLVYDWISGWKQELSDGTIVQRDGALPLFRNIEGGKLLQQPRSLLIDSSALESGEGLTDEFRRLAEDQIAEFQVQYRLRTGKQADDVTDADLMREALNTVGRHGRLGEKIRCVVSVAMLSEGWDANTVTHILGVRAFRSQLLCEQVIGRGLRRTNYVVKENGLLEAQYADVYGVPFALIPTGRVKPAVEPPTATNLVRALPGRQQYEIKYPRVAGYRYRIPTDKLVGKFDRKATLRLKGVPTEVEVDPIVGRGEIHRDNWQETREQTVAFHLAQKVMATHAWEQDGRPVWLFPQVLDLSRQWLRECLVLEGGATTQMLLLSAYLAEAADKIRMSFVRQRLVRDAITPTFMEDGEIGSTESTEFMTARRVVPTKHSHVDFAALPPKGGWEALMVDALDASSHVVAWVKNEHLGHDSQGLQIPWVYQGTQRSYLPDFIAWAELADSRRIHLIIEVSGFDWPGKREKDETTQTFWIPAINNWGQLGHWEHVEFDEGAADSFDFALLAHLEKLGGPYG